VGYAENDAPVDPIPVPAGKPFGCRIPEAEVLDPVEIRSIDFEAVKQATCPRMVADAMGLAGESFNGNRVVLSKSAFDRIHSLLREHQPATAVNTMFALADYGFHTTLDEAVPADETWLLDGWRKDR
jgi:hypothetical protein